jgi:hypothetical protein
VFGPSHSDLFNVLYHKGSYDEAIAEIVRTRTLNGATPEAVAAITQAYAAEGIKGYWRSEKEAIEKQLQGGRAVSLSAVSLSLV